MTSMGEHQLVGHGPLSTMNKASVENLTGHWTLVKDLSDDMDPLLKMQKVNWVVRRAIAAAPLYLYMSQYTNIDPERSQKVIHLDVVQRTSVGIAAIECKRTLNWVPVKHEDYIFGAVLGRARLIRGCKGGDGIVRPDIDLNVGIESEEVMRFLRGEINADGSKSSGWLVEDPQSDIYGEGSGLWMHSFECDEKSAWTGETIWGFEIVNGERFFTTRVVVIDSKGNWKLARGVLQRLEH